MYKVVILMLVVFLSVIAGCIFSMNDKYDKVLDGGGSVYTISGKFIDRNGNPIVGLRVQLKGEAAETFTTDSNGDYMFENVSPGSYTITPGDRGHSSKNIIITNKDMTVSTNKDGHGGNLNGDYSCSGCHKS